MKTVIDFRTFTDEDVQQAYAEAWNDVGGTIADAECATPWCCPWYWEDEQHVFDLPECHTMEDIAKAMLALYPEARIRMGEYDVICFRDELLEALPPQVRAQAQKLIDLHFWHSSDDDGFPEEFNTVLNELPQEYVSDALCCVLCEMVLKKMEEHDYEILPVEEFKRIVRSNADKRYLEVSDLDQDFYKAWRRIERGTLKIQE